MENIDPEEERRRLRETYGQMTEDELCAVADDAFDLTPIAKETLQAEIQERGLKVQLNATPPSASVDTPDDDLVGICRLWDQSEAARVKGILDAASIPSYLGPENVFDLEDFKSGFEHGVDLKVSAVMRDHAMATLAQAESEDEEDPPGDDEGYVVLCPKCSFWHA